MPPQLFFVLHLSHSLLLLQRAKMINLMLVIQDEDRKLRNEIIYSPLSEANTIPYFQMLPFEEPPTHPHLFTLSYNFFVPMYNSFLISSV